MIRVFLLGVLGLIALAMVARNLPKYAAQEPAAIAGAPVDETAPFARWAGAWEGEFVTRRPDGTVVEITKVRQEYTDVTPGEQRVVITDRHASGETIVSNGFNQVVDGGLECRLTDQNGISKILKGRRESATIFWHRRDAGTGLSESFREQILALPAGDLYTIDGFGIYGGAGGTVLLFEGRYHRVSVRSR